MANQYSLKIAIGADLDIKQVRDSLKNFQGDLSKLQVPKQLFGTMSKEIGNLDNYLKDFQILTSKTEFSNSDVKEIVSLYGKIKKLIQEIGLDSEKLKGIDIEKLMPKEAEQKFQKLQQLLVDIQGLIDFKTNLPEQLKETGTSIDNTKNKIAELKEEINNLNQKKTNISTRQIENATELALKQEELKKARSNKKALVDKLPNEQAKVDKEIEGLEAKVKKAEIAVDSLKNKIKTLNEEDKSTTSQEDSLAKKQAELDALKEQLEAKKQLQQQLKEQQETPVEDSEEYKKIDEQIKQLATDIAKLNQEKKNLNKEQTSTDKDIKTQNEALKEQEQLLTELEGKFKQLEAANIDTSKLQELRQALADIMGVNINEIPEDLNEIQQVASKLSADQIRQVEQVLKSLGIEFNKLGQGADSAGDKIKDLGEQTDSFDKQMRDVEMLKSRIQYFFGLNNAINLVRRTIRSAFQTIQDLDKAMTATAVVTDFTVGDMWKQLPDYTKRANELGVSTLAAYEASTLYYQQGLKTEEVMAMSNETLKMARIAGLEAADATDRMTNAIRGFNMEINKMNAQRVNDVYSKLAAISASNVDEISTAMTKVASLAHNANMDFETTAAFLAQIIETTRESPETAGTALKTVVARFSEVKKLVSEDQLTGQDEEGQTIDVNKVSSALRTAGIDLNKYFLGEVGLDDIFMELASKWDNLTSIQQRYIATQAAGSRQQSRFIAMMQDYARTQELVSEAYNSNGAAEEQFAKTQDSLESKLARFKNAWNEFAMGIMNSDVTKFAVELLTKILDLVNQLTSLFGLLQGKVGGVISSILKLTTLMGALKLGKGLFEGISASIVQNISGKGLNFGEAFKKSMESKGILKGVGKGILKSVQGIGKGSANLIGGIFGKAGLGANLSGFGAGLAGIATVLAAAGAVYLGYQWWLNNTAKGKLKKAQQEAEKLKKIADEAKEEYQKYESLDKTYKEKTADVENATTIQERQEAIKARNEAIMSAIEENPTLAQYVITERIDDKLVLTIDEVAFENAMRKVALAAAEAEANSYFGQAKTKAADYNVSKEDFDKRLDYALEYAAKKNLIAREGYKWDDLVQPEYASEIEGEKNRLKNSFTSNAEALEYVRDNKLLGEEWTKEIIAAFRKMEADQEEERQYAITGYKKRFEVYGIDNEGINSILSFLGDLYVKTEGEEVGPNALKDIANNLDSFAPIFDAYNGTGQISEINASKFANIDFSKIDPETFGRLLEDIGITSDALEELENVIGVDAVNLIREGIKGNFQEIQVFNKQNLKKLYSNILKNGIQLTPELEEQINNLSLSQVRQINDIFARSAELLTPQQLSQLDINGLIEKGELDKAQNLLNSINLNNPISAFYKLKEAKEEALKLDDDDPYRILVESIAAANKELFSTGGLIQSFISSDAYAGLTDDLKKFIKENGKITADNIEDLAKNCSELQTILEKTDITAQGLAKTFTLLENGDIAFDDITSGLLSALSVGESFDTLLGKVKKDLEEFDKGFDMTSGTAGIIENVEEAQKYLSEWQFGNKPLINIYDSIFGPGAYDEYMSANWGKTPYEEIEADITKQLEKVKGWAENEGLGALQFLASEGERSKGTVKQLANGSYQWDLSGYENAADAISDIADRLGVTEEKARAFVAAWGSHMWDLGQAWDEIDFEDQINAFVTDLGNGAVVTSQQLDALAKATGKSSEEILTAINQARRAAGEPIVVEVNWKNDKGEPLEGTDLIEQVEKEIEQGDFSWNDFDDLVQDKYDYKDFNIGTGPGTVRSLALDGKKLDIDDFISRAMEKGFSESQAKQIADKYISGIEGAFLTKTIKIPNVVFDEEGNGHVEYIEKTIKGRTVEELELIEEEERKVANSNADAIAGILASANYGEFSSAVARALESGLSEGAKAGLTDLKESLAEQPFTVKVRLVPINKMVATGGIVGSYAAGSRGKLKPGIALTGEEAPEIVWNKEKGYAYITGVHGPQFQNLKPGDQVFNGQDTKKILQNNEREKLFGSYANGIIIKPGTSKGTTILNLMVTDSGTGSKPSPPEAPWKDEDNGDGSGGGGSEKKDKDWKTELDWLYDLMEDIAEEEHKQTLIQSEYELAEKDLTKTGRDLFNLTKAELETLSTQLEAQQFAFEKRLQQMNELQQKVIAEGFEEYLRWNSEDNSLEIDWDKINEITDKDTYDKLSELISDMEKVQDQIDEAQEATLDIKKQIQELQSRYLQAYLDFQDRVMEAVVAQYQQNIDNFSTLNDTINEASKSILDSIQKEIDLQRQIRDNTDTEKEIADIEARLAMLQRDTTGANQQGILELQKQLDEARKGYSDTLVDQAIDRLSQNNDNASTQRDKQIELLQAQLEYWQETGALWQEVAELIASGFTPQGSIIQSSELWEFLKKKDSWQGLSQAQKDNWANELILQGAQVGAYLIQLNDGEDANTDRIIASIAGQGEGLAAAISVETKTVFAMLNEVIAQLGGTPLDSIPGEGGYASGGLATKTGLAMLHGTANEPEYVLNARQTDAFLRLAEVLPNIIGSDGATNSIGGNVYVDLTMNVGEIGSDYDVDRLVARVKEDIYSAATYRNVNAVSFLR